MFCLLKDILIYSNVLYTKKMEICPAYISKYNSDHRKQITLLMIPNEKGWHYLAVKKLSALLRGIISKNNCCFYCLNYPHSFRTENKLKCHQKLCKNKFFVKSFCQLKRIIH